MKEEEIAGTLEIGLKDHGQARLIDQKVTVTFERIECAGHAQLVWKSDTMSGLTSHPADDAGWQITVANIRQYLEARYA